MFGHHIRAWWSDPVDYIVQVQYFTKRTMSRPIQLLIGLGTGLDGVISLTVLLPSAEAFASRVAVLGFALLQFVWAGLWCCRPWPSRRMSLAFVVTADIGIAAVAVVQPAWLLGLFALNAFGMISVYLMFFDGPKALASHAGWILLTTTAFAVQLANAAQANQVAVAAQTLISVAALVATPLGIQLGIWSLRNDANESVTDPLTGLLNRRGLHLHIDDLLRGAAVEETDVAVMSVDLDRFKEINDTYGHAVGDQVLIRSARRITSALRGSALVARVGGEEFVVVDVGEPGQVEVNADRVRQAIAAPADRQITASVGATSVPIGSFVEEDVDPVALLDTIIQRADRAMFDAKRNGRNATIHVPQVDGAD
ncbi:MAG: GGDEF domain-containing protein [Mycobacterium sp.]